MAESHEPGGGHPLPRVLLLIFPYLNNKTHHPLLSNFIYRLLLLLLLHLLLLLNCAQLIHQESILQGHRCARFDSLLFGACGCGRFRGGVACPANPSN